MTVTHDSWGTLISDVSWRLWKAPDWSVYVTSATYSPPATFERGHLDLWFVGKPVARHPWAKLHPRWYRWHRRYIGQRRSWATSPVSHCMSHRFTTEPGVWMNAEIRRIMSILNWCFQIQTLQWSLENSSRNHFLIFHFSCHRNLVVLIAFTVDNL